jgi:hypothetical protein
MTKQQATRHRQLELSLLSDLNSRLGTSRPAPTASSLVGDASSAGASERDLSVYRQISSSYFDSLRASETDKSNRG